MNRQCECGPRKKAAEERPGRRLNILMVEDSENDALLIADALWRAGLELSWKRVESAAELRAALAQSAWSVVLSDYRLPGFSALEAFRICQESGTNVPFLVVSGSEGDDQAAAAMKAGIRGWMVKDDLGRLAQVVAELSGGSQM
jgi:DNA-binding NtrC family response regulator